MAKIVDLLAGNPSLSFEFFPPKTDEAQLALEVTLSQLATVDPTFVSVTYGAGGTVFDRTHDVVVDISRRQRFPAMPHLTCVGHTRAELRGLLDAYASQGIDNVLALAGDPPADGSEPAGDFRYAVELVELIREHPHDFSIGVAAFPEVHPRSSDRVADRSRLVEKLAVADFAITQFFFDADDYFSMVAELAELGNTAPVIPGIMPVLNTVSARRFSAMNGARVPEEFFARLEATDDPVERFALAVEQAAGLSRRLLSGGAPGLHYYCLNRSDAVLAILDDVGIART